MSTNEALFELARRYGVPELSQLCLEKLVRTMTLDNTVDEWLEEAQNVFEVIESRLESLPQTWASQTKTDCGQELRERLYLEVDHESGCKVRSHSLVRPLIRSHRSIH